jgi:hypothetical protein
VDNERLWNTQRALFGFESDEEVREITIEANGDAEMRAHTQGLSWNNCSSRHLRIRLGTKPDLGDSDRDLRALEFDSGEHGLEARIRRLTGLQAHELTLETRKSLPRISFTRRVELPGMYALSIERSLRERMPHSERWRGGRSAGDGQAFLAESTLIEPWFPTRRLIVNVRLPSGYVADEPIAKAIPLAVYAVEDLDGLHPRVHPEGFRFTVEHCDRLLTLEVDRPLVGLRYVISWLLAGARERPVAELLAEGRQS